MTGAATVGMPNLATHQGAQGLTITASTLATVPMVQAHLAVPLAMADRRDLAVFDVLAACWPDLPACARFEQVGGVVSVSRKRQWLMLSLSCTADLLPLLAETLAAAVGADYTADRVRVGASKSAQQATLAAAQPAVDSNRRLWEAFYGHLPPFADAAPDPEDVAGVAVGQVTAAHQRCIVPGHAHLLVVGDVETEQAFAHLDAALQSWAAPPHPVPVQTPTLSPVPERRMVNHARPGWQQSHIRLAAASMPRHDFDAFAAALVASLILGGNFSSRINTVLREQQGLAYYTFVALADHLDRDVLVVAADVKPSAAPEAVASLLRIFEEFAATGPTEEELAAAVGYTTGTYTLSLGSQSSRASCVMSYLTTGVPVSGIVEIPERIAGLRPADVRAAAQLYRPDRLSGVLCGDPAGLPGEWR